MIGLLSEDARVARKPHQCDYCAQRIGLGDPYIRSGSVQCGEAYTTRLHVECHYAIARTPDPFGDGVPLTGEPHMRGRWLDEYGDMVECDPARVLAEGAETWRKMRLRALAHSAARRADRAIDAYLEARR